MSPVLGSGIVRCDGHTEYFIRQQSTDLPAAYVASLQVRRMAMGDGIRGTKYSVLRTLVGTEHPYLIIMTPIAGWCQAGGVPGWWSAKPWSEPCGYIANNTG